MQISCRPSDFRGRPGQRIGWRGMGIPKAAAHHRAATKPRKPGTERGLMSREVARATAAISTNTTTKKAILRVERTMAFKPNTGLQCDEWSRCEKGGGRTCTALVLG
jgi:hypothetical protein